MGHFDLELVCVDLRKGQVGGGVEGEDAALGGIVGYGLRVGEEFVVYDATRNISFVGIHVVGLEHGGYLLDAAGVIAQEEDDQVGAQFFLSFEGFGFGFGLLGISGRLESGGFCSLFLSCFSRYAGVFFRLSFRDYFLRSSHSC